MHPVIENIINKAKQNIKTIVLPESDDVRILEAALEILKQKIAKVVLIGKKETILNKAIASSLDLNQIEVIDPLTYDHTNQLANRLYELRKDKGMTLEGAKKTLEDPIYFATMLVKEGYCDGMVAGAASATSDTFRPALQIIKTSPDHHLASSYFVMITPETQFGNDGLLLFADCALNLNPDSNQLAEIATQTGDSFKILTGVNPKIALLSYSTHNSGQGDSVNKVKEATKIASSLRPDLLFEGEVQADTALNPPTCSFKCPECQISGDANVLIFPNLDSANISYKLVQRLGKVKAFGPISQGLNKPISDLSRGCNVEDIIITVAITSLQASTPSSR
jgi:phosphate acetyltransferase